ncbi:MAG: hypothetical protein EOM00_13440 [Clostridia bacterium]|nr:hypothetical protein [Clostridia bacterium]
MDKQNIGNAGEYYIASVLSANNFIATITLGRAEAYDILCVSPSGNTYKVSVKTRYDEIYNFPLNIKNESLEADDFFYAFVILKKFENTPDFWIIPSKRVAEVLKNTSKRYFLTKKKDGGDRNDVGLRKLDFKVPTQKKKLYDDGWEEELTMYYKNFGLLK